MMFSCIIIAILVSDFWISIYYQCIRGPMLYYSLQYCHENMEKQLVTKDVRTPVECVITSFHNHKPLRLSIV